MPVNKEHLLKIKQHILEEPNRLVMDKWIINYNPGECINDTYSQVIDQIVPECGTVGCLAGWSYALNPEHSIYTNLINIYREATFLGIDESYFFVEYWPSPYKKQYEQSTTPQQKALILSEVIDFIIKHNGELPIEKD